MINPGVPYISTSQAEIFEHRIKANRLKKQKELNKFVSAGKDRDEDQDGEDNAGDDNDSDNGVDSDEDTLIQSQYKAYQLKTVYNIKTVMEIDWENEEEDSLIL